LTNIQVQTAPAKTFRKIEVSAVKTDVRAFLSIGILGGAFGKRIHSQFFILRGKASLRPLGIDPKFSRGLQRSPLRSEGRFVGAMEEPKPAPRLNSETAQNLLDGYPPCRKNIP
jgi:hypothetical protein